MHLATKFSSFFFSFLLPSCVRRTQLCCSSTPPPTTTTISPPSLLVLPSLFSFLFLRAGYCGAFLTYESQSEQHRVCVHRKEQRKCVSVCAGRKRGREGGGGGGRRSGMNVSGKERRKKKKRQRLEALHAQGLSPLPLPHRPPPTPQR